MRYSVLALAHNSDVITGPLASTVPIARSPYCLRSYSEPDALPFSNVSGHLQDEIIFKETFMLLVGNNVNIPRFRNVILLSIYH
jgi:hypothetical protein